MADELTPEDKARLAVLEARRAITDTLGALGDLQLRLTRARDAWLRPRTPCRTSRASDIPG